MTCVENVGQWMPRSHHSDVSSVHKYY